MRRITLPTALLSMLFMLLLLPTLCMAQTSVVQPTETLWTNGKIFVVLIVAGTIFAGIGLFLIILERKLSKLEKTIADKNP